MLKNILITGGVKSGKSTLLRNLVEDIPQKTGFVTNEILDKTGRVGFEIETSTKHKISLAHINSETPHKVGRFFVNIQNLKLAVAKVAAFRDGDILYLDEIGQMQLLSEKFKDLVIKFLDSENICLTTLSSIYQDEFIENVKERDDVILVEISAENREAKKKFIKQLIAKIERAQKYITEPERFTLEGREVRLKSEHDIRRLVSKNGKWHCDCDFFQKYKICSHSIAAEGFIKKSSII
jgi:nucleoside-triphosphatase